jgi:hypothetical protein
VNGAAVPLPREHDRKRRGAVGLITRCDSFDFCGGGMSDKTDWWVKGLLFENCSCQVVCPGHFHFSQDCTHERCVGYWGIEVEDGKFGETPLAGIRTVIVFDAPQRMVDGGWIVTTYVDRDASADQVAAMEKILCGAAGGPWQVLERFVGARNPTRQDTIVFTHEPKSLATRVGSVLRALIKPLKGRDRGKPVTIENNYNQIHAPSQELGMGPPVMTTAPSGWRPAIPTRCNRSSPGPARSEPGHHAV